ncbi:hypothetical protein D6825_02090 [Candidatus Woesearchaeota archaeon]|nr:MAG: hypothetical protein D6825_02090 [Candidatus Woesearchaeota archaeon]
MAHETHTAQACKPKWVRKVDSMLYWILIILAIIGNFAASVALVPILMTMKGAWLAFFIFFTSIAFGFIFSTLLHTIEALAPKEHVITWILIPSIALINITIITLLSNKLIELLNLTTPEHSPLIIGLTYIIGYIAPEAIQHAKNTRKAHLSSLS